MVSSISALSKTVARRLRPAGAYHLPPPAQPIRSRVELVVEEAPGQPKIMLKDTRRDLTWRVAMTRLHGDTWTAQVMLPMEPTVIHYHFEFPDETVLTEQRQVEGETIPVYGEWDDTPFQISVYNPQRMPPAWTRGMVIYQIFPDRFANGDPSTDRAAYGVYGHRPVFKQWGETPEHPPLGRDFFGGDLRGVIAKLDYLRDLGVDCIYFTPIFASPTNHRYDANDYLQIDPMLGTEADFDELIAEADERGLNIVLDGAFNHCSTDSRYFGMGNRYDEIGAIGSNESPYYRWFTFTDYPREWIGWYGFGHMPEFTECPEVEEFFTGKNGPTGFWTRKGVMGWRADVTPSNSDAFWQRWRTRLDSYNPANYTVAEEWRNASNYLVGDMFSATMNYRFAWALRGFFADEKITASEFDDRLQTWLRDTPQPAQGAQMNLIDSHDTGRAFVACGENRERFKQIVAFQFAYIGAPMIYYGDETGLTGGDAESARQTMPWDDLDTDLIAYYQKLTTLRHKSSALRLGSVETVVVDDRKRLYAFVRRYNDERVIAAFNAGDSAATMTIPVDSSGMWRDALGNIQAVDAVNRHITVELAASGAVWLMR
jgi:glycosidase